MNLVCPAWHCMNYQYQVAVWNHDTFWGIWYRCAGEQNLFSFVCMLLRPSMIRLFSVILLASCFIVSVADGFAPPCRKNEGIRRLYLRHLTTHDICKLLRSLSGMTWRVGWISSRRRNKGWSWTPTGHSF